MQPAPDQEENESQEGGGSPINLEVVRSFLTFAKNAIAGHKLLVASVVVVGLALAVAAAKYAPPTFQCQTEMMTVSTGVLDSDRGQQPLAGAEGMIMSHDNLERLIKDIDLKKKYRERRPPLLAFKDRLMTSVFGPMSDKILTGVLIGTLGTRVSAEVKKDTLIISVQWTDGQTAAEITEALRESFLRSRHTAEMSAFQDKMAILDSHAAAMRAEVTDLAQQMKESLAKKKDELKAEAKAAKANGVEAAPAKRVVSVRSKPASDAQLPELRERHAALKQQLTSAENDRSGRIRDEQAKLNELTIRLTPSHPQVMTQQERVAVVSQVSSELALLRSEVADLESQIRQRESMQQQPSSLMASSMGGGAVGSEPLPTDILGLLDERDADPALAAQVSGAVVRYGSLRDDIRGAKLALDTAQAAFSRRYQVTVPVEAPTSPIKPKRPVILGIGFALSLLIAFVLPILLEIRRDVVVERWQVNQLQLPVLAVLRLPPDGSKDRKS
ncbi:MAG: Chain length determinant protein [Polyangiaceae bacterium]|nr:Chain length determinant protein [Polyangiaceae bacterium]